MNRCRQTALFAALAWLAAGCSSNYSGVGYVNLGVRVTPSEGGLAPEPQCFILPVLVGSRVERRVPIEGALAVRLLLSRDAAELSFEGDEGGAQPVTISADELRASEPFARDVSLRSATGAAYVASVSSECE